jgi:hypothetical protein
VFARERGINKISWQFMIGSEVQMYIAGENISNGVSLPLFPSRADVL